MIGSCARFVYLGSFPSWPNRCSSEGGERDSGSENVGSRVCKILAEIWTRKCSFGVRTVAQGKIATVRFPEFILEADLESLQVPCIQSSRRLSGILKRLGYLQIGPQRYPNENRSYFSRAQSMAISLMGSYPADTSGRPKERMP